MSAAGSPHNTSAVRVLWADDVAMNRRMIARLVKQLDYTLDLVADGDEVQPTPALCTWLGWLGWFGCRVGVGVGLAH